MSRTPSQADVWVELLATSAGGRQSPVDFNTGIYRPHLRVGHGEMLGVKLREPANETDKKLWDVVIGRLAYRHRDSATTQSQFLRIGHCNGDPRHRGRCTDSCRPVGQALEKGIAFES